MGVDDARESSSDGSGHVRGTIFCYSGTGNTLLACRHLASRLAPHFDVVDVTMGPPDAIDAADIVGFATSTDFWGVPQAMEAFVGGLPKRSGTPAFVLNTFGAVSGKTLSLLAEQVSARGFIVAAGHSLRMPESYPPMLARGMSAASAPSPKRLAAFDAFVADVGEIVSAVGSGADVGVRKLPVGLVNSLVPTRARTTARDDMGEKSVDASACSECGTCARGCPYGAIRLDPKPVFDMARCYGCWRCYNRCPNRAIRTAKLSGAAFYSGPSDALRGKLS